ncbi:hypothetical protein OG474_09610 [Kribbella sp. NBC_01505]|uniref:VG15 protein n=1 Tax=Kribbella sp. NBC_01505 TaxID=2903580 RepID=UPI00386E2B38
MSAETLALTNAYRVAQARAAGTVAAQATIAFRTLLNPADLNGTFPQYLALQNLLVGAGRRETAQLAAAYYTSHRFASGIPGAAEIVFADPLTIEQTAASLLYTGPVTVRTTLAKGATIEAAMRAAESSTLGAIFRIVADGGRNTIHATTLRDTKALGFARVTDGKPCAFCAMLASRGFVYKSEETAGGQYHDRCGCFAQPMYRHDDAVPGRGQEFSDLWSATTGEFSGAEKARAFRRAYDAQR